jgi:hypothetical protein
MKIQINSQKTRFWKEKSVENVVTLGPTAETTLVLMKSSSSVFIEQSEDRNPYHIAIATGTLEVQAMFKDVLVGVMGFELQSASLNPKGRKEKKLPRIKLPRMFIGWLSKVKLPFLGVRGQHK